jgi:hypothetical protein
VGKCPPPDSNPLETRSLEKIKPACQANSPQPRIAASSSTNVVHLSSARTTNRFPSSPCASAIQIVRPLDQSLRRTSVCGAGRLISTCALSFWICDACSFRFAGRASISFCFSAAVIFCLGTVDLSCEKVASLIRPSGFRGYGVPVPPSPEHGRLGQLPLRQGPCPFFSNVAV